MYALKNRVRRTTMGLRRNSGGGTFVPEAVDLMEDFYEANYSGVKLSSKEFEDETTEYAYLLFDIEGDDGETYTVSHRVPAKMSMNGDEYPNSKLVDTLQSLGLWEVATKVVEDVVGEEGAAKEMRNGDSDYVVEGEEDYDEFESILNSIFAGKSFRVLVETYERTVNEDQAEESVERDDVPTYEPGESITQATVEKLSEVVG